jgi:hypothetical protein
VQLPRPHAAPLRITAATLPAPHAAQQPRSLHSY